jgi:hypothetical protein
MAIDSAAKRRSVAHIARKWSGAGVTPDVTKGNDWRHLVGRGYNNVPTAGGTLTYTASGGISFGGAATVQALETQRIVTGSGGITFGGSSTYRNVQLGARSKISGRLSHGGRRFAIRQSN